MDQLFQAQGQYSAMSGNSWRKAWRFPDNKLHGVQCWRDIHVREALAAACEDNKTGIRQEFTVVWIQWMDQVAEEEMKRLDQVKK